MDGEEEKELLINVNPDVIMNVTNLFSMKKEKKVRKTINFQTKLDIINLYLKGMRIQHIANMYNLNRSTVTTIIKDKSRIMQHVEKNNSLNSYIICKKRNFVMEKTECILSELLLKCFEQGYTFTISHIKKHAAMIHNALKKKFDVQEDIKFAASSGWYARFKKRSCLPQEIFTGMDVRNEKNGIEEFCKQFNIILKNLDVSKLYVFFVMYPNLHAVIIRMRSYSGNHTTKVALNQGRF